MKKFSRVLCLILVVVLSLSSTVFAAGSVNVTASAAIVMDYDTGEILYAKDIDTKRVPASMTKIMTAYIIYEELGSGNITKDSQFFISDSARAKSRDNYNYPASVPLVGDTISVDTLLKLIMLPSASASCIVAAENISGSEAKFVERMNETAQRMGISATYYNSHGAEANYVSARAIATLIRNFISEYPDILTYTSMKSVKYNGTTYANTNKLLSTYYYEGVDGFKTGTLSIAGYCLSATATRDGRRLITVVMDSDTTGARHTDSQTLLDYGFAEIAKRDASRESAQVTISTERPLRVCCDMDMTAVFSNIETPFEGTATLYLDGNAVASYTGKISNGTTVNAVVNLDESYLGTETLEAVLTFSMPDGSNRSFPAAIEVSQEPPAAFPDITFHWAEQDINAMHELGLANGFEGMFRPDESITRAEFITMVANSFEGKIYIPSYITITFPDIEGHWAEDYIEDMASAGIIEGYEDDTFRPDDYITRQEVTTILQRVLKLKPKTDVSMFADGDQIASWAVESVATMTAADIIKGYEDNTFRPEDFMTRAETTSLIYRAIK